MRALYPTNGMAGAHISLQGVSHRYHRSGHSVLRDVNLEIKPSEAVAMVGRSGCGKSTLLHIISGLTLPTTGRVRIDGNLVQAPSPRWAMMFQQPHLYPWMSVAQNIGLGLKFAGTPRGELNDRVHSLIDLVDLRGFDSRNAQELSGGQQQRVALARSLAVQPEVLLLDEPFSALDAVTRRALQRDVRRIASEFGITLVIVTHDISEAVVMAERACVMASDPGRIAEIVTIDLNPADRERRDAKMQTAQNELQTAFERATGYRDAAVRLADPELRITADYR